MRASIFVAALALTAAIPALAQSSGPYHVVATAKVGGDGGWDYVYADAVGRRLYIPRSGQAPVARITVFDLDSLKPVGEIPNYNAHGVAVDPKSNHGFASSKPVLMFDTQTLKPIKDITVDGNPDGILFDAYNQHVYIWSHAAPNATVIDTTNGNVLGTIDLGGQPEQAQSDGAGHIYVDLEDKGQVAVVDAKTMKVTAKYDVSAQTNGLAGLALDNKNHILFVVGRSPAAMVMVSAADGKILGSVPMSGSADGAAFNPATNEAFASLGSGTLAVVKENSPTSFSLEQDTPTKNGARTLTLDPKTGRVLVITADRGPPAPPAPDAPPPAPGRGPRPGPILPDSFSIIAVGK